MIKMLKKMTLDELKAELNAINSSDNHTRKIEICIIHSFALSD